MRGEEFTERSSTFTRYIHLLLLTRPQIDYPCRHDFDSYTHDGHIDSLKDTRIQATAWMPSRRAINRHLAGQEEEGFTAWALNKDSSHGTTTSILAMGLSGDQTIGRSDYRHKGDPNAQWGLTMTQRPI